MTAMKIERTRAHFLGDVLATVPKNSLRAGDDWARSSYNAFKMPPGFRGILELSRTLFNVYKIADMLQQISPFVRPFPLPIVSRALSFFPSPQPPYDTNRPLRRRETQVKSGLEVTCGQFLPTNLSATIGN